MTLQIAQYPKYASGTPMNLNVAVEVDETGNNGMRLTTPPTGPDGTPIDTFGMVLVDSNGNRIPLPSGGSVLNIATFATANTKSAPVGSNIVQTSGYSTTGDLGGAAYVYDATVDAAYVAAHPRSSFTSANGRGFKLLGQNISVPQMGLLGDGATDDFPAWLELAALVTANGGGTISFIRGKTYYWGQYVTGSNGVVDAQFLGCLGLTIEGNGAKIDIRGNFNRDVNATRPLSGLKFLNCTRLAVKNIEIDGNNDQMTKAGGVAEPTSHCLDIYGCTDILLQNVELHHHAADGYYISSYGNGVNQVASKRLVAINVNSHHNGRQALSVIQLRDAEFFSCDFTDTGNTGAYGNHAPTSGIDVEPNYNTATASPNAADVNTGNITFYDCTSKNNLGPQWDCGIYASVDNVKLRDCVLISPTSGQIATNAVIFDVPGGLMDGCYVDCQQQTFVLGYADNSLSTVDIVNTTIKGNGPNLFFAAHNIPRAGVKNCRIIGTHTAAMTGYLLLLNNPNLEFESNYVWMPKEGYNNEGSGDYDIIMFVGTAKRYKDNTYATDLPANQGGATTAHYANTFGTTNASLVFNDKYIGTVPGAVDTFRPSFNNVQFDSFGLYNKNHKDANPGNRRIVSNNNVTLIAGSYPKIIYSDIALTAGRTVTLPTNGLYAGLRYEIIRGTAATGAFNLTVTDGTTTYATLTQAGLRAIVESDGTTWFLVGVDTVDPTITLTGDVTGTGVSSFPTVIANGAVTLAKQANMPTASVIYRKTAGSGAPEVNALATLKTDLNVAYTLFNHFADVGSGTTVETDLYADIIPAGQLSANGDKLEATYSGVTVASATATRDLKIYFAGTNIFDSSALTINSATSWEVTAKIIRVSAAIVRYSIVLNISGIGTEVYTKVSELTGLTLSNANTLKITGQAGGAGAATNDIVAKLGYVNYKPA